MRDHKKINKDEWKAYVEKKGVDYVMNNIVSRCVSKSLSLGKDNSLIAEENLTVFAQCIV